MTPGPSAGPSAGPGPSVHGSVDHLFRRQAGRMVALLTRSLGPDRLEMAEEVVQDALLQALKRWPFHGLPDNPAAWLYRVAHNLALDRLRRETTFRDKATELRWRFERDAAPADPRLSGELTGDQLRLIFLCCHPELPRDARVALTLKTVLGFSVREIARAFLAPEPTIAQRLVRAQRRIRDRRLPFEVPSGDELPERLDAVLEVLYLLFNEGYTAHDGDELVRRDLCQEAVRLVGELADQAATDRPAVHALAALLSLQAARLPARLDDAGRLVVLPQQDRRLWDRAAIAHGFRHLELASDGDRESVYHLQAAIAAQHAMATEDGTTDWEAILSLYDRLWCRNPSPVVAVNRAVAVVRARGPREGLAALAGLENEPRLRGYYLFHSTRAELLGQLGDHGAASQALQRALECGCSEPERRFLAEKLASLSQSGG